MTYYSLLIVEDEDTIRRGLVSQVPWERYGFHVASEAGNGREALEIMAQSCPDAVLTDIKMPSLNGIDLMERIRNRWPDVKVVILSGYGDFEFARKGIEYGAFAYILKPTKEREIEDVFTRLKSELDHLSKSRRALSDYRTQSLTLQRELRDKYFEDILRGRYTEKDTGFILDTLSGAGVDTRGVFSVLLVRAADGGELTPEDIDKALHAMGTMAECAAVYRAWDKARRLCTVAVSGRNCRRRIASGLAESPLLAGRIQAVGVSFGRDGIMSLHSCYAEAEEALAMRFFQPDAAVIFNDELPEAANSTADGKGARMLIEAFTGAVAAGDAAAAAAYLNRYVDLLIVARGEPQQAALRLANLAATAAAAAREKAADYGGDGADVAKRLNTIAAGGTIEDARGVMAEFCKDAAFAVRQAAAPERSQDGIDRAVAHISANFMRKLTLEDAAGLAYMNPSYFSKQFKLRTGSSFIDYVTALRLEHAAGLLKNSRAKVYEAAMQAGYDDYRHFCKVFRKRFGMSPTAYKAAAHVAESK